MPGDFPYLGDIVELRRVGLDDLSDVRYVHASAFRRHAAAMLTEDEVEAFVAFIQSPGYVDHLQDEELICAVLDGQIVGTAGWCPADDNGTTARIRSVYVAPGFWRGGIARRLLEETEARARRAGFTDFALRCTANAIGFFEHMDYAITSHGVRILQNDRDVPVAFLRKRDPLMEAIDRDKRARRVDARAGSGRQPAADKRGPKGTRGRGRTAQRSSVPVHLRSGA